MNFNHPTEEDYSLPSPIITFAIQVWVEVFNWLGLQFSLPHSLFSILNLFRDSQGKKARRKGLILIWSAVVWVLWRMRNAVIFENDTAQIISVVDNIKLLSSL
jgi:hypothetical protein